MKPKYNFDNALRTLLFYIRQYNKSTSDVFKLSSLNYIYYYLGKVTTYLILNDYDTMNVITPINSKEVKELEKQIRDIGAYFEYDL